MSPHSLKRFTVQCKKAKHFKLNISSLKTFSDSNFPSVFLRKPLYISDLGIQCLYYLADAAGVHNETEETAAQMLFKYSSTILSGVHNACLLVF